MTTRINVPLGELCLNGAETVRSDRQDSAIEAVNAPVIPSQVMSAAARRFWSRVNKDGPTNSRRPELGPCWLWTGSSGRSPKGERTYGHIMVATKRMGAHRFSFLLHGGTVSDGFDVMHLCDIKSCVRPSHLQAGTRTENLIDGFRSPANHGVCAGENNGRAVLNWDIVHVIRERGGRTIDLARQYGVSTTQITAIKKDRKWPEAKCPIHGTVAAEQAA